MRSTTVTLDIEYAPGLLADVYERPDATSALVVVHGGGWTEGDKAKDADLAERLSADGFQVVVPNYRLAPAHPFPAGRDDVITAVRWTVSRYAGLAVGVLGTSAGGNLAMEAGLALAVPIASWSGPLDLEALASDRRDLGDVQAHDPTLASAQINQAGRDDAKLLHAVLSLVAGDRSRLAEASPIRRASSSSGPTLLVSSTREFVPLEQATAMQHVLARSEVECALHVIPGTAHAKGYMDRAYPLTLAFLRQKLAASR